MRRLLLFIFLVSLIPSKGSPETNVYDANQNNFKSNKSIRVDLIIDGLNKLFDGDSRNLNPRNAKSVNYLKSEMQRVGRSLLSSIQYFLSYIGLFRSNNKFVSSVHKLINSEIRSVTIKDEVLRQYLSLAYLIPLHSGIATKLNGHFRRASYQSKGYAPSRFDSLKFISYNNNDSYGFNWLSLIQKLIDFVRHSLDCMDSAEWYDLQEAFAELINHTFDDFKRVVEFRLKRSFPSHPNEDSVVFSESQAFICHILVKNLKKERDFNNCLRQVREIEACSGRVNVSASSDRSLARVSKILRKGMNSSIESDCVVKKTDGTLMTFCSDGSKSNLTRSLILLFSQSNRNRLSNSPSLRFMMDYVSRAIIKNDLMFNVYKELVGMKRMFAPRYSSGKKLRHNLSGVIFRTIGRVHEINTGIGRKLIDVSEDSKRVLSKNLGTMRCVSKFLELLWNRTHDRYTINKSGYLKSAGSEGRDGNPLKNHEKSIRELVVSMRSLSELNLRKSSRIFTLANTFLLATVFYECISILVTLMYRADTASISNDNPVDHNHNDEHHGIYITTEQINVIDDNYGEYGQYEQQPNRIHRRETGEQYSDFSSVQDFSYDDTEKFDFFNFYDLVIKKYV